jgi:NitT/TauT family transport system permease protein
MDRPQVASSVASQGARRVFVPDALLLVVGIVLVWQLLHQVVGRELPSPLSTLRDAWSLIHDPGFLRHLGTSSSAFSQALLIAGTGGLALGVMLGMRRLAAEVAEPILAGLFAIPKVVLYPVFLSIFGLTVSSTVAFAVVHGTVPIIIIVMSAIQNIPRILLRSAHAMRLSPWGAAVHILVPATIPEIISAMRIGFSLTLMGTLIGEMYASKGGIGFMLVHAMANDDPGQLMAIALLLFVFATLVNYGLLGLERRSSHKLAKPPGLT